jgi:hypothetical protein
MARDLKKIFQEAATLPENDRATLAGLLLESLDPKPTPAVNGSRSPSNNIVRRRGLTSRRSRRGPASVRRPSRLEQRQRDGVTPPASRASHAGRRRTAASFGTRALAAQLSACSVSPTITPRPRVSTAQPGTWERLVPGNESCPNPGAARSARFFDVTIVV